LGVFSIPASAGFQAQRSSQSRPLHHRIL